jgi:hypothetical protein
MTENTVQESIVDDKNHFKLEGLCLDSMLDRFSNDQLKTLFCNIKKTVEKKLDVIKNSIEDHIKFLLCDSMLNVCKIEIHRTKIPKLYLSFGIDYTMKIDFYSLSNFLMVSYENDMVTYFSRKHDFDCFVNNSDLNTLFDEKTTLKLTSVIDYMKFNNPQQKYYDLYNNFF